MAGQWWRRLFRVDEMEKTRVRSFHREITTDGYGVGIHMNRPTPGKGKKATGKDEKTEKLKDKNVSEVLGMPLAKSSKRRAEEYNEVWGIDPGRTDFITTVNQEGKAVRFSTSDFYHASGYSRSNRKSRHHIDKSPRISRIRESRACVETASLARFPFTRCCTACASTASAGNQWTETSTRPRTSSACCRTSSRAFPSGLSVSGTSLPRQ
ncbi:hypothetical protein P3T76_008589 [Phytophthora citrophthora]|uniref:Uncharacterized protein n=1 Tax=Phytophthora citrophthora TaxID=4793 RepID=A0AAD9GIK4_9STRA|nr:hypothetical protein P3T76_008589 [Phytophthora citrophthora]